MHIHEMLLHPFIYESHGSGKMKQSRARPFTLGMDAQSSHHNGRHIFRANFPDLCNQVTERRSTARRRQHDERMATHCNEIRQVAFHLHGQGTYPSAKQITKQLSYPQAIRTREGHEAWRLILEELGYTTGHLKG